MNHPAENWTTEHLTPEQWRARLAPWLPKRKPVKRRATAKKKRSG